MALAHVQTVGAMGENISVITSPSFSSTAGNLLHVDCVWEDNGGPLFSTLEDNKSNTFEVATASISARARCLQMYAKDMAGGSGHTVTLTLTGNGYGGPVVTEISGADPSAPFDQSNIAATAASPGTSFSSGNITTTQADEILCGAANAPRTGSMPWSTSDADYTQRFSVDTGASIGARTATRIVSATETNDFVMTVTNAGWQLGAAVASYKAETGPPPPPPATRVGVVRSAYAWR